SFTTDADRLAGFLRLSMPSSDAPEVDQRDLADAAIVREVHVYGQSLEVGVDQSGAAQHIGLGTHLMREAEVIAHRAGFDRLAVISALGTRGYYRRLGYELGESYMIKSL
ncbi:MAG: tRNA uridine(34) 5-carboxymethylaminomethyl modification radical SAM/GNAT enzyme Elp3, partial [Anaerolineales bacterium]